MNHRPEHFKPAPHVLYAPGAGPTLDRAAYCVSALVTLHGTDRSTVVSPPNLWWGHARLKGMATTTSVRCCKRGPVVLGAGLVEMGDVIASGREPLAHGRRGLHIVEMLIGILSSAASDTGHMAISLTN